jgi:chemotaxis protein MotB
MVLAVACLMSTACVKKSTHRVALTSLEDARSDIATLENEVATLETEQAELTREMQAEQQRRDSVESALHVALSRTEADRRAEVERLNTLLMQQGTDYNALRARLQSLAAVEQEVRERNAIYENVIARFRSLMDGGQLSVAIERGRLVILLPQDVLFESGSATLGQEGRRVIAEVARVLAGFPDRQFQVEGHTDNVPIATERFPSNWELSSARALAVVRLLTQNGVVPGNVSGAAYGEFQPVAPNEDRDARRRNRRIEIVMLPNLDLIAETELPGNR